MTRIDIISGFLGAGKTTLIQLLLKDALQDEQVVLIENEFGEIGIDGGFLKNSGIEIKEMNSGCICCSLVGDFGTSLKEAIETYHPDRIIIEPSGVGKLSDVIKAVEEVQESCELRLNSYITVVDATKCKLYLRNAGEFYKNQLEYSSTVILSRTDKASREKVEEAVSLIRQNNKDAHIITTPIAELGGKKVLEVMENALEKLEESAHHHEEHHHHEHDEDCSCHDHGHHHHEHSEDCGCHGHEHHDHHDHGEECSCGCHGGHHHHDAEDVFTSWGKETIKQYSKQELEDILDKLSDESAYGMVFRAKGMVEGAEGGWHYFDMVPGEFEVRSGAPEFTGRLCVIGSDLKENNLEVLFAGN